MMHRRRGGLALGGGLVVAALAFSVLLSSCSRLEVLAATVEAKLRFDAEDYSGAVAAYARALGDPRAAPYAAYGLGAVYLAMGETGSALSRFDQAAAAEDASVELRFRASYDAGIAHFRNGDYAAAIAAFRTALEYDSGREEAKANLELSIARQERSAAAASSVAPLSTKRGKPESSALFDYLRQQESQRWKSREWKQESESWLDY